MLNTGQTQVMSSATQFMRMNPFCGNRFAFMETMPEKMGLESNFNACQRHNAPEIGKWFTKAILERAFAGIIICLSSTTLQTRDRTRLASKLRPSLVTQTNIAGL